jgi:predicted transcriptional regulator YdeE
MEPQIVKKPALTLVGLKLHGKIEGMDIKSLWNTFGPRMTEIKDGDPSVCYGAMDNYNEATGEFDYMAACEAKSASTLPKDMISWNIPAQTYAVFPCILPQIGEAWMTAYQQWLPQSGYKRAAGPSLSRFSRRLPLRPRKH